MPLAAYKTADETVTSSTTLQPDNDLTLAVAANAFYEFVCSVWYKGAATGTGDLKFQWSGPASSVLRYDPTWLSTGFTAQLGIQRVYADILAAGTNGVSSVESVKMQGFLTTAGTTGSLLFNWAQNTSNATATTVGTGSVMTLRRVG